jgi:DNA-binding CsgD family transcriptional regulator
MGILCESFFAAAVFAGLTWARELHLHRFAEFSLPALELLAEVVDTLDEPRLILDCAGRILHRNGACDELFARVGWGESLSREAARMATSFDSGLRDRPAIPASHDSRVAEVRKDGEGFRLRASFLKPTSEARQGLVLLAFEKMAHDRAMSAQRIKAKYLLTPRETQVMDLLSLGQSNKSIAEKLGVSLHTARHHTERVLAKVGAKCRAEVGAVVRGLHS